MVKTNNINKNNNNYIMLPKVDYCFKEIMKDEYVLKGFLSAVLNIDVKDIQSVELLPTELHKFFSLTRRSKTYYVFR